MEIVKVENLENSTEFWNVNENEGYSKFKASDGLEYKVWTGDENQELQKLQDKLLSHVRTHD